MSRPVPIPGPGSAAATLEVGGSRTLRDLCRLAAGAERAAAGGGGRLVPVRVRAKPGRSVVVVLERRGEPGRPAWIASQRRGGAEALFPFPHDPALPALAPLLAGECGPAGELVRYKPGERCVVRLVPPGGGPAVFAKLHAERADAAHGQRVGAALAAAGLPVPMPLGWLPASATVLTAEAGPGSVPFPAVDRSPLIPLPVHGHVAAAARALARLHGLAPATVPGLARLDPARHTDRLAVRAGEVAASIGGYLAAGVRAAEARVAAALRGGDNTLVPGEDVTLVHGAYKPSQLRVADGRAAAGAAADHDDDGRLWITDLDGLALGDPAHDVGYFLAYLRPTRRWGVRRTAADDALAARFTAAYAEAVVAGGGSPALAASRLHRAPAYAAAAAFKITARRAHRLQAPRPGEIAGLTAEIGLLLADGGD